jgi:SAM-dependent methyltransferase
MAEWECACSALTYCASRIYNALKLSRKLLHFGCGPEATLTNWEDYDGSWNAKINTWPSVLKLLIHKTFFLNKTKIYKFPPHVRYLDLRNSLPFADKCADAIYASHTLEHLYYYDAKKLIKECFRILKPGGSIRIVVPNLNDFILEYLADQSKNAAMNLHCKLLYRSLYRSNSIVYNIYNSLTDFHSHKFMYDPPMLIELLSQYGFKNIFLSCFNQSKIPEVSQIETTERVGPSKGFACEGER